MNIRAITLAVIGLGLTAGTAQAGSFGFGFHYNSGPRYYASSCYRPAYYAPVRYYEPAPVVVYDTPAYSPVVYRDTYCAPTVYYSRPTYRVYSSHRPYYRSHRGHGRRVAYYR